MSQAIALAATIVVLVGVSAKVNAAPAEPRRAARKTSPETVSDLLRRANAAAVRRDAAKARKEQDKRREAARMKTAAARLRAAEMKRRIATTEQRRRELAMRLHSEWKAKLAKEKASSALRKKKKHDALLLRNWGVGITIVGGVLAAVGLAIAYSAPEMYSPMFYGALPFFWVGISGLIAGPVMWGVGNTRLTRIYREERKHEGSALQLPRAHLFSWRLRF